MTYASVGSGTGIQDISNSSVDFGASDAPMTTTQAAGCVGCIEVPWVLTGTTLSYNVPGAPNNLHLSGPVIAGIYLGTITNWNDPQIAALNPKFTLPNLAVTTVHRSDGSGDTYAFTNYLSYIDATWSNQIGYATAVAWPGGDAASGNAGVAGIIANTPGAIGYISAAYTIPSHLKVAAVKNAAGYFATPGLKDIEDAAAAFTKPKTTFVGANGRRDAHRQPAEECEDRLPDLDLQQHHLPAAEPVCHRAAPHHLLGAHDRQQDLRAEADLRTEPPGPRALGGREGAQDGQLPLERLRLSIARLSQAPRPG